jgi:hypothetical protein
MWVSEDREGSKYRGEASPAELRKRDGWRRGPGLACREASGHARSPVERGALGSKGGALPSRLLPATWGQAARSYSWTMPPRTSRRVIAPPSEALTGWGIGWASCRPRCGEGHQNLDQASDQVERPALCRVIPPREEGCGCQKLGPQVPSSGSTKGGIRLQRKYKIPDHCLNRIFGHYAVGKLPDVPRQGSLLRRY